MSYRENTSARKSSPRKILYVYTRRQRHFPMLHDDLLSHHINLSFPLRWQRISLPPSSHSPKTTQWALGAQTNTDGIPSLFWSTTVRHCFWEVVSAACHGHMESWAMELLFPSGGFPGAPAHHAQWVTSCTNRQRWQYEGHPMGLLLPKAACFYDG